MDRTSVRSRARLSQVVIAAALLVVFCAALTGAASWPVATGLYPRIVSVAGIVLSLVLLVGGLLGRRQGPTPPVVPAAEQAETIEPPAEDDPAAVFTHADRRAWLCALGWIAAFLAGLAVVGLYVTVLVFTVVYLRIAAASGWLLAIVYAVVASGVLYLGVGLLLHVPVPEGLLW